MRITTWGEYGVICALHLARRSGDGLVSGREIAESEHLPPDYAEQVLLRLRRAGIVTSTRGARGGYTLARPAELITVREILAAAELVTFDVRCDSHPIDPERCAVDHDCSIRPVWRLLQTRIDEVLESVKLADLLEDESTVRHRIGLPVLR